MKDEVIQQATDVTLANAEQLIISPPGRASMVDPATVVTAMKYLYWFGYLAYELGKNVTVEDIAKAIKKFQDWFRVKESTEEGKLGIKTFRAMHYPRCGCPDCVDPSNGRHREYLQLQAFTAKAKPRWNKYGLKYFIKNLVPDDDLPKTTQEAVIAQAWKQWTSVARLHIEQTECEHEADLLIDTGRGAREDFDGPAGTLAWAYMPTGKDEQLLMRFDLDETWTADRRDNGVCMLNVACHEFGHMLGLDHSKSQHALMAPFYNESIARPQQDDDIVKIQALYGPPHAKMETPQSVFILRTSGPISFDGYDLVPRELVLPPAPA